MCKSLIVALYVMSFMFCVERHRPICGVTSIIRNMQDEPQIHPSLQRLYALALEQFNARGPTEVGRLIGESSQVVNNWGRERGVSKLGAVKIQTQLGWSALWIREGIGPKTVALDGASTPPLSPVTMLPPRLVRRVPIVGQVRETEKGFFVQELYAKAESDLDAVAAFTGGAPVRALVISTDAFYPRFRSGEFVVVANEGSVANGDDVFVHLRPTGKPPVAHVQLYQFLYETDGVYVFQHFREPTQVTRRKGEVLLMEPVFGSYNKRAKLAALKSDEPR
jgi:hypothetical protein